MFIEGDSSDGLFFLNNGFILVILFILNSFVY